MHASNTSTYGLLLSQISCPLDYRLWQQSMYCCFGQKWAKLHHGQMGSVVPAVSTDPIERNPHSCNTMQVRKSHSGMQTVW